MGSRQYSVRNKRRGSLLCSNVRVIDANLEPLTILRVLVEGLAANAQTGLWLTNMTSGIPMVPRISPFDLLYLDKNNRVLSGVELLPTNDFPQFKKPAVSALVLPFQSFARSKTRPGDPLVFRQIADASMETEASERANEKIGTSPAQQRQSEPLPAESDCPSFDLDACAPEQQVAAAEAKQETAAAAPHAIEFQNHEKHRRIEETVSLPEPVSLSVAAGLERRIAEPYAERVGGVDNPALPLVSDYRPRVAVQDTESKGRDDAAKEAKEKEWMVSRFLRWLYPGAYETDRRKGRRIPIPNLVAYQMTSGLPQPFEVEDISATGMFLITEERWQPGSLLSFSLQREGPRESGAERRIELQSGAVRWASNGVGLSFVLPNGMDVRLWQEPSKDNRRQSEPEYVIREFRAARAIAFIKRICPPAVEESRHLIYDEISNVRAESAVNIFLKAEERLAQEQGGETMLAHPELVVRLVEGGSWADSEWIQNLWAGLLVASCTADGCDDSNLIFVNLLSQFATIQARILAAICEKAVTVVSGDWVVSSEKIFSTSEEMARMAGSHDLLKIHRSLAQLAEFGLLEKSIRASFVSEKEGATTTPTGLGLRMYSRCLGRRRNP